MVCNGVCTADCPCIIQAELLLIEKEVDDIFQEIQFQMKRDKALQDRNGKCILCFCFTVTGSWFVFMCCAGRGSMTTCGCAFACVDRGCLAGCPAYCNCRGDGQQRHAVQPVQHLCHASSSGVASNTPK